MIRSVRCFLVCVVIFLITDFSFGQSINTSLGVDARKSYPTPEIAKIAEHGLYPASTFNGTVGVAVPLHNVSYKDLSIPISLSYSTKGNRVEERPGVVGLGWSLMAGGSIYRKVNGIYDEHADLIRGLGYEYDLGYYYIGGRIASDARVMGDLRKYTADMTGFTTSVYLHGDSAPDEFMFNVNGMSGTFFFFRENETAPLQIKVRTNGNYTLKADIMNIAESIQFYDYWDSVNNKPIYRQSARSISKIKLTDENGIQYIFGGDSTSIEFSYASRLIDVPESNIAQTWHLTEVISPFGYKINLEYEKKGRTITRKRQRTASAYHTEQDLRSPIFYLRLFYFVDFNIKVFNEQVYDVDSYVMNFPSYLKKITAPNQTISFDFSRTNDLLYNLGYGPGSFVDIMVPVNNQIASATQSMWQQLNSINLNDSLNLIEFYYRNNDTTRLRLDSIAFKGEKGSITGNVYKFEYDTTMLPNYGSKKEDHWGYYNGVTYAFDSNYLTLRTPDTVKMQAEVLKEITYPTGGYLKLEYEPHFYHKVARQYPFTTYDTIGNVMAGGLRVKKMSALADANSIPVVKEYFYVSDYLNGGTFSSGVLSGLPRYTTTGRGSDFYQGAPPYTHVEFTVKYYFMKGLDNNFFTLHSTNGADVTYTEVVEKNGDSSYTKFVYSNLDNGYMDKPPYLVYGNYDSEFFEEGFISLEPYRGLNLKTEYYNNNKQLLKSIESEYLIDTSNTYKVPYIGKTYIELTSSVLLSRALSLTHYTKPALLKKTIEKTFDPANAGQLIVETENVYMPEKFPLFSKELDNYKPVETLVRSSKGDNLKKNFTFPYHFATASPYSLMLAKNMVAPVVQSVDSNLTTNKEVAKVVTTYNSFFSNKFIAPVSEQRSVNGHPLQTFVTINQYDFMGNILQQTDRSGVPTTFLWGYRGEYPVVTLSGADWNTVKNYVDTSLLYASGRTLINNEVKNVRNAFTANPLVNVQTFDYKPLVGMIQSTDPNNYNTYYEYDRLHRLARVKDRDGNIIQRYIYKLYNQAEETATSPLVFYSAYQSKSYTRNNCTMAGVGETMVLSTPYGMFTSSKSQAEADSLAFQYLTTTMNGQDTVNTKGSCTWFNIEQSRGYTKECYIDSDSGSVVVYTVPAGTYSSTVSYSHAQTLALNEINLNGQNYANANGICILNCTTANCGPGLDKRCVSGSCETGTLLQINCEYDDMMGMYKVWYVYMFSDLHPSRAWFEYSMSPCDWF